MKKKSLILLHSTSLRKKPHPDRHHTAINMSAALSKMYVQTRTQQRSHTNTPFLCTTGLVSGNTGERRYLCSSLGVGGQQRPRVFVLMWHSQGLWTCFTMLEQCLGRHRLLTRMTAMLRENPCLPDCSNSASELPVSNCYLWHFFLPKNLSFFHLKWLFLCIPVYFKCLPWRCGSLIQEA